MIGSSSSAFQLRLLSVENEHARRFYETEALRGGWSVRQLDRQIDSQSYERIALSRNKTAVLSRGQEALPKDAVRPEKGLKDQENRECIEIPGIEGTVLSFH